VNPLARSLVPNWVSAYPTTPFDVRRLSCLSLSFGNPAARGSSGRACGFVSRAFAQFTLVETESTSIFSIFRKPTASTMREYTFTR